MPRVELVVIPDDWTGIECGSPGHPRLRRLRAARLETWNYLKALTESAARENRAFTGDEQAQWEQGIRYLNHMDGLLKAWLI